MKEITTGIGELWLDYIEYLDVLEWMAAEKGYLEFFLENLGLLFL